MRLSRQHHENVLHHPVINYKITGGLTNHATVHGKFVDGKFVDAFTGQHTNALDRAVVEIPNSPKLLS
jgi:hypothetical protein